MYIDFLHNMLYIYNFAFDMLSIKIQYNTSMLDQGRLATMVK